MHYQGASIENISMLLVSRLPLLLPAFLHKKLTELSSLYAPSYSNSVVSCLFRDLGLQIYLVIIILVRSLVVFNNVDYNYILNIWNEI